MEIEPGTYIVRRKRTMKDKSIDVAYFYAHVTNYEALKKEMDTYRKWAEVDGSTDVEMTYKLHVGDPVLNW